MESTAVKGLAAQQGGVRMDAEVIDLAAVRERRQRRLNERPMTKKQLAEYFGRSVRTVDRWVKAGCPIAFRFYGSGPPMFYISQVEEWHDSF